MVSNGTPERAISVFLRRQDEIEWYLEKMQGFLSQEIAAEATLAMEAWKRGKRQPALTVITRWYNTIKHSFGIEHAFENVGRSLDMEQVLLTNNHQQHLDLLMQMIVTLKDCKE